MNEPQRSSPPIIYTWTDEAPALATYSFLPVLRAFAGAAGVPVETRDISLAGRILAAFPERLGDRAVSDDLADLGEMVETPEANIIKLPNISASIPQLNACIAELQAKGYDLPDYPMEPASNEEKVLKARYDAVKGSAVNPVLRQGNSDRRSPASVKRFAQAHPPRPFLKEWPEDSATHVATMDAGDFRHNEISATLDANTEARIEHVAKDGTVTVLKESLPLLTGEVLDATFMSGAALDRFLQEQIDDARDKGVLFSLHLKATMMKVSDPIIFGHAVRVYFRDLFDKYGDVFEELGVNPNNGFGDVVAKIAGLPEPQRAAIEADIQARFDKGPAIAMVDSDRGITNLHVPSDIIIDASIPPMIRDSGRMWNPAGELQDCKAVIPDSCYAGVYDAVVRDCQAHGQFDRATMGSVSNVGLMAQKAEEYGSHDKTFEVPADGIMRVVDGEGRTLLESEVEEGDIWRACQAKDVPIRDWVKLAVARARATGAPAVFWLDEDRGHDRELIKKVSTYLQEHDLEGLRIEIMPPVQATEFSLERIRCGEDTVSVTGNVLRDYLTDLFPILEIGTSARVLSIVPLLAGGGLFETGAGGSAPKHVQQFQKEGHLRWDSLGEYLALTSSFEHLADRFDNPGARVLAETLDAAVAAYLENGRSPGRKVHELDNRGSTFYLTLYWAQELAQQTDNAELAERFGPLAAALAESEERIVDEINATQGSAQDLGGYYKLDLDRANVAMRPSVTFNEILAGL